MSSPFDLGNSIVDVLSDELKQFIRSLFEANFLVRQGAIIDHDESEIEYQIHITLGDLYSRTTLNEKILTKLQSYLQGFADLGEVIDAWGTGLPYGEDLKQLQVLQIEKSRLKISFKEILSKVKSELIIISIRKEVSEEFKLRLVSPQFSQSPRHLEGGKIEAIFTVSLDYANLWGKSLASFNVKNIVYTFNLRIHPQSIEMAIPEAFKKRILDACRKLYIGNSKAIEFMSILSRIFLSFQDKEVVEKLASLISVDPPDKAEILNVTPKMESFELAGLRYPIVLPGTIVIRLRTQIRESEIISAGKLVLDLNAFNGLIRDLTDRAEIETRKISF